MTAPSAPFARTLVVVNPIAGRGRALAAAERLADGLRAHGVSADVHPTAARGDATQRVRNLAADTDLVVAVGGDGTLREVLEGLPDPRLPVGLLPYGTANVLRATLHQPRDVRRALEVLLRGRLQEIDVARVNGRLSFLCTGVGFDAACVQEVEARRRGPIHKWTYVGAGLRVLRRHRAPRLTVELDGTPLPEPVGFCLLGNTDRYAGWIRLARGARLDDGALEVYVVRRATRTRLVRVFFRGLWTSFAGTGVELYRARRVRITAPEPVPYQIDGDLGGVTPVEVELAPNRYRLVVP